MIVHEVFAQIFEQKVKNVIVCESYSRANYITKATYGRDAFAVDCLQYPCAEGDLYIDGIFYHIDQETNEHIPIKYVPTQEQQVAILTAENNELTLALAEMIGGM